VTAGRSWDGDAAEISDINARSSWSSLVEAEGGGGRCVGGSGRSAPTPELAIEQEGGVGEP
jgi:hypothetical protein